MRSGNGDAAGTDQTGYTQASEEFLHVLAYHRVLLKRRVMRKHRKSRYDTDSIWEKHIRFQGEVSREMRIFTVGSAGRY